MIKDEAKIEWQNLINEINREHAELIERCISRASEQQQRQIDENWAISRRLHEFEKRIEILESFVLNGDKND